MYLIIQAAAMPTNKRTISTTITITRVDEFVGVDELEAFIGVSIPAKEYKTRTEEK